ncbi:MAG: lysozyme inhibitor LprI family protein [Phormidesmis sp.]
MSQQNWPDGLLKDRFSDREAALTPRPQPPKNRPGLIVGQLIAAGLLLSVVACTSPSGPSVIKPAVTEPAVTKPSADEPSALPTPATDSATAPIGQPESAVTPDNPDLASQPNGAASAIAPADETTDAAFPACDNPQTQQAMNRCAQASYTQADAELNRVYQAVKAEQPSSGKRALGKAEVAWLAFRDLDCEFERSQFDGGSMAPMIYSGCLSDRTQTRTAELRRPALPNLSYQAADAQLNQTYQSLLAALSEDRQSDLVEAQIAWIEYRDSNCAFEVLYSPRVIGETQCLARMSVTRTAQLEQSLAQSSL